MSKMNRIIIAIFLGGLALVVFLYALFDIWLMSKGTSISWSMYLLPSAKGGPFLIFTLGFFCGGIIFGLAAHFWTGMSNESPS